MKSLVLSNILITLPQITFQFPINYFSPQFIQEPYIFTLYSILIFLTRLFLTIQFSFIPILQVMIKYSPKLQINLITTILDLY